MDRLLCAICGGAQNTIGYMGQQIIRPKFSGRSVPAETLYCILRYEYVADKETIMAATAIIRNGLCRPAAACPSSI